MLFQIALAGFSCTSIWLLSRGSRWGFVIGLMGQPLWFYATVSTGQWGIFAVTCWFTVAHLNGIRNGWRRA